MPPTANGCQPEGAVGSAFLFAQPGCGGGLSLDAFSRSNGSVYLKHNFLLCSS